MGDHGRYLYAVARGLPEGLHLGIGLSGRPLEVVRERDLSAVVSTVSLDEFGEEGLRTNLERLDWLEEVARAHDAVVHQVAAHGPTAPLRLATVCMDDEGVRHRVVERYDDLMQVLDRVQDCREWSVKVITPPRPVPQPEPVAAGGADYLRRKKAQSQARLSHESEALETADRVHEALSTTACACRRLPAQDPRLTGHQGTMVLNAAYLVHNRDEADFLAALARVTGQLVGLTVEHAGPWPPYSFAMLDTP